MSQYQPAPDHPRKNPRDPRRPWQLGLAGAAGSITYAWTRDPNISLTVVLVFLSAFPPPTNRWHW